MKILLVVKQKKNIDAFLGAVACLVDRGHVATIAVQERDDERDEKLARGLATERVTVVRCPSMRTDEWTGVAQLLRSLRDCVHYLRPPFGGAVKLQTRIMQKLRQALAIPVASDALAEALRRLPSSQIGRLEAVLKLAEHSLPTDGIYDEFLASHAPDVLLLSPLVHFGSAQADLVASARRARIPVWMLLFSWDNLSTKGTLHCRPDMMFVWNEQQQREAHELHGFPQDRVVIVGAPRFDSFFALQPVLTRAEFHEPAGLDPSKATLLYVCSSRFVSEGELAFVRQWVGELRRSSSSALRECNIIVRPHPDVPLLPSSHPIEHIRWSSLPGLTATLARPFGEDRAVVMRTAYRSQQGLYESIAQSAAVVGLNTSAELEAGIIGRPVYTILAGPRDADGQSSTLHFYYLLKEQGGFVSAARTFDEHLVQLDAALREPPSSVPIRAFIQAFLRPHGIEKPVAPILADAIEQAFANAHGADAPDPGASAASRSAVLSIDESAVFPVERPAKGVIPFVYEDFRIQLHVTPEVAVARKKLHTIVEKQAVEWLRGSVGIGDVVYDLGAGVGLYTLIAAKHRGALVVAIESGYSTFARLCDNVLLNACDGSVVPISLALADQDGLRELKYKLRRQGRDRYTLRDVWRPRPSAGEHRYVQPVCATPLDAVIERYGLPAPNHMRLSRTAATTAVLAGAVATLALPELRSVFMTIEQAAAEVVIAHMESIGWAPGLYRSDSHQTVCVGFQRRPAYVAVAQANDEAAV